MAVFLNQQKPHYKSKPYPLTIASLGTFMGKKDFFSEMVVISKLETHTGNLSSIATTKVCNQCKCLDICPPQAKTSSLSSHPSSVSGHIQLLCTCPALRLLQCCAFCLRCSFLSPYLSDSLLYFPSKPRSCLSNSDRSLGPTSRGFSLNFHAVVATSTCFCSNICHAALR